MRWIFMLMKPPFPVHGTDKYTILGVTADALRVVADNYVAGLKVLRPEFLGGIANGLRYGADEGHDAVTHRHHGITHLGRSGKGRGHVIPISKDDRECGVLESPTHALAHISIPVAQQNSGEYVAIVGPPEFIVRQVFDQPLPDGHVDHPLSIWISP
jgi:hypothetical protein